MKKILILCGHPRKNSLCGDIAKAYEEGAKISGADVKLVYLSDLNFSLNLMSNHEDVSKLEPDIIAMQKEILDCNHIVIVFPTWWANYPAILKGFIDRVFLPGFAYKIIRPFKLVKLLPGRSAHIITTLNAPPFIHKLLFGATGIKSLKNSVLKFCGINPVKVTMLGPVGGSTNEKAKLNRQRWIENIKNMGQKML